MSDSRQICLPIESLTPEQVGLATLMAVQDIRDGLDLMSMQDIARVETQIRANTAKIRALTASLTANDPQPQP